MRTAWNRVDCSLWCIALAAFVLLAAPARGQFPGGASPQGASGERGKKADIPKLPAPEGAKRLTKTDEVWIDTKKHEVIVDGYIALREGYLEMLSCLTGTKEHEAIIGAQTKAQTVHAALLAAGAKSGHPVKFRPKFEPPTGTEIEIEVRWLGDKGEWQSAKAQDWIRDSKTKKVMTQPWVFAGSGFWKDEKGKDFYMAESGDFICVSNFTTAMLDIPIESSQSNEGLLFEANTEKIPPLATPVRMVLRPKLEKKP